MPLPRRLNPEFQTPVQPLLKAMPHPPHMVMVDIPLLASPHKRKPHLPTRPHRLHLLVEYQAQTHVRRNMPIIAPNLLVFLAQGMRSRDDKRPNLVPPFFLDVWPGPGGEMSGFVHRVVGLKEPGEIHFADGIVMAAEEEALDGGKAGGAEKAGPEGGELKGEEVGGDCG